MPDPARHRSAPTPGRGASTPRVGVLVFPGSNDDRDLLLALEQRGADAIPVWHKDRSLPEDLAGIAIPGGFSYGDYLRCGAMARFSPVMPAVETLARAGRPVLGICNGFQILCEAGLLPGALVRNRDLRFLCEDVRVRTEQSGCFELDAEELRLPIKHGEGAYVPDPNRPPRVAFRYLGENPNGTTDMIAGVVSDAGNVLGLMPHPEHAVDERLGSGSVDGVRVLDAFLGACLAASA